MKGSRRQMIIDKYMIQISNTDKEITLPVNWNDWLKSFDTASLEPINQNSIEVLKFFLTIE